jgi:DNA-binding PadR family transcriptional regulator
MSGAEIVEEIERETGGKWKPSSGSIYPLLAWLHDKGYTTELSNGKSGMKRYVLTDEGKAFFKEQVKFGRKFLEKLECLAPMLIGGFQFAINNENMQYAHESVKRVSETFMNLRHITDKLTKQDVQEIAKILDDTDKQLKKIARRTNEKEQA